MIRRPPRSTRPNTLFPYTTLFRSLHAADPEVSAALYSKVFGWSVDDLGFAMMIRLPGYGDRSEEHTSELQSLMRISYAVFCLKKQNISNTPSSWTKKTYTILPQ